MSIYPKEDGHIKIKVIGIGGCGGNALNNMIAHELRSIEFVFADTDARAVSHSHAKTILQLDADLLRDDGSQSHQEILLAERKRIRELLDDTEMVLIVAGMGGAVDIKLASIIAETAKDLGIFTLSMLSTPLPTEGQRPTHEATAWMAALSNVSDSVLMLPNQILTRESVNMESGIREGCYGADHAFVVAVRTISDLLNHTCYMRVDLTDMRAALCGAPQSIARMAYGSATGEGRAIAAARRAISCPLMGDVAFHAAQAFLILVSGNEDILLDEYDQVVLCVQDMAKEDAIIICGMACDDKMGEALSVAIIVANIERQAKDEAEGLQSLFTRMNPGGTMLSREDRMDALLKLNGNKDGK